MTPTKTAMMDLIEFIDREITNAIIIDSPITTELQQAPLKRIRKVAVQLKADQEKTQIVDARTDGFASTFIMGDPKDRMLVLKGDNETYFTQTYKQ